MPSEESDLRGTHAVTRDVEQIEILQGVGANELFRLLRRSVTISWDQLRADISGQYCVKTFRSLRSVLPLRRHPANEVLDKRLGNRGIHVVVAHLVADAVCAPTQSQFRQVSGSHHQRVVKISETKKERRSCAGLNVLVGDIVLSDSFRRRMINVSQHLSSGLSKIDLLSRDAEASHEIPGC